MKKISLYFVFLVTMLTVTFDVFAAIPPNDGYRCSLSTLQTNEVVVGYEASPLCSFDSSLVPLYYVKKITSLNSIIGCSGFDTGAIGSGLPVSPTGFTALRYTGFYGYSCGNGKTYTFYRNNNPVAGSYSHIIAINSAVSGTVIASDPDYDQLTYLAYGAMHGATTINSQTGAYTYTPDQNYQGADAFFVDITDGKGGLYTSYIGLSIGDLNAGIKLNYSPTYVNQVPQDSYYNSALSVVGYSLFDTRFTYSVDPAYLPAHGTVAFNGINNGQYRYTPQATYLGMDYFGVIVRENSTGKTDSGIITVEVLAALDRDHDGISNVNEAGYGTDPDNPDTDYDGLLDGDELTRGTNPLLNDTDGDGIADGLEVQLLLNPLVMDTDQDGMSDGFEVHYGLLPKDISDAGLDPDVDGLTNLQEFIYGTNPNVPDTDGDGQTDGYEVAHGTSPTFNLAAFMPVIGLILN